MRRNLIGVGFALALASGCTETPQPVAPVQVAAPVDTAPAAAVTDLAPVAEPQDIFMVARWKNPNATIGGLASCAGVPQALVDTGARILVDRALEGLLRNGADAQAISEGIAWDAPVDVVMSLDPGRRGTPNALYAFSIPLTSLDRGEHAIEAAGGRFEVAPGLFRAGRESSHIACAIGPSAGPAPARLICGQHEKDLVALGPYLARNVPVGPAPGKDLHAELRWKTVDARYGGDLRRTLAFLPSLSRTRAIGEPRFDRALEDAASAVADEAAAFAGDLDRFTLDLGVDPASCLTASASLDLRGKSSWIAGNILDRAGKAGPPPPIFWRAPVDSVTASYAHGSDPARYSGVLRVARGMIEGALAKQVIGSEPDRKALAALLDLPLHKDTNMVFASGLATPVTRTAAPGAKFDPQQFADDLVNAYLGWYLVGVDEGPESITKLIKDAVSVYGRKGLVDPLRKSLGRDADMLPAIKLVAAPRELGKGALDVEMAFAIKDPDARIDTPRAKGKAKGKDKDTITLTLHLLLMSDGGKSTWVAVGTSRAELIKRLLSVKGGAPDSGTLAARPGLEALRSGQEVSGGFVTLAALTRAVSSAISNPTLSSRFGGPNGPLGDLANTLNNLPHKGDTPIFLTSTALASSGEGPRSEVSLNMQKGSFEDLGAVVMTVLRIAQSRGLLPGIHP